MALFSRKTPSEDVEHRLRMLAEEVAGLRSGHKRLELEWEELYDKVRHQMARMSRRAAVAKKENGDPPEAILNPETGEPMDPISAGIHARRGSFLRKA